MSEQLRKINNSLNKGDSVKVGADLDTSKIQSQAQQIPKQIQQAVKSQEIGVTLSNLDEGSIKKIKNAIKDLDVSPDISRAMTEQLDQICVQIDKISAKWDAVVGKEEKALTVSLNGTDQLGRTVAYVGTYNAEMGQLEEKSFEIVDNLEKQRNVQEQLAKQAKKANDSNQAFINQQKQALSDIWTKFTDINSSSYISDTSKIEVMAQEFRSVLSQIDAISKTGEKLSQTQKEHVREMVKDYGSLLAQIKNAESADESRVLYLNQQRNLVEDLYSKYTDTNASKPIVYEDDLKQVNSEYQNIIDTIEALGNTEGRVSAQAKSNLETRISSFARLAKEMQNAEYVATKLRTKTTKDVNAEQVNKLAEYESKLRSSGKLTESFQSEISNLRKQLESAFDSKSLTDYLNQFDQLKSEVGSFNSQLSSVNDGFKKLAAAKSNVFATKGKMLGVDVDSNEYKELERLLASQVQYQKEISSELGKQIAKNPELIKYASEYKNYQYASAEAAAKLAIQEGRVKDAVKDIDASISPR